MRHFGPVGEAIWWTVFLGFLVLLALVLRLLGVW